VKLREYRLAVRGLLWTPIASFIPKAKALLLDQVPNAHIVSIYVDQQGMIFDGDVVVMYYHPDDMLLARLLLTGNE
jgi:hypothetical protein